MTVTRSAKERLPRLYTACGNTLCDRRIWRLPGIVSPTAMTKLAIDSGSLEPLAINREICIPNREIGRSSLFYQKSGDLPLNRETWKLCILVVNLVREGNMCDHLGKYQSNDK